MKKSNSIQVYFSDKEADKELYHFIEEESEKLGTSKSVYVRMILTILKNLYDNEKEINSNEIGLLYFMKRLYENSPKDNMKTVIKEDIRHEEKVGVQESKELDEKDQRAKALEQIARLQSNK